MVAVYDYYGLILYFKAEAHLPITLYVKRDKGINGVQFTFEDGLLLTPQFFIENPGLDTEDQKTFEKLVELNSAEIVKLWLDYFIYKKELSCEIIKKKIGD